MKHATLFLLNLALCLATLNTPVQAQSSPAKGRIDAIRRVVDSQIAASSDLRKNYVHLYGVANYSTILAIKRGLSPELAHIIGLLHDISYVKHGTYDRHDELGASMAKEIMEGTKLFTKDEIEIAAAAILHHDNHTTVHGPYDEVLKDADILQPYLNDVTKKANPKTAGRLKALFAELGLSWDIS